MIIKIIIIFSIGIINDVVWTLWINFVGEKKPIQSSIVSGIIYLLGAYSFISYVNEPILILPGVIGSMIGTYGCVKYLEKR